MYDFSEELVETGDLDPVYIVLWEAQLNRKVLCKWLVAYWCFYHVGTASWITTQADYWEALAYAASNKEHPRSSERRHFRGQAAVNSAAELQGRGLEPYELVEELIEKHASLAFTTVADRVKRWRGFGDWIAFKVADMLERLELGQIEFTPYDVFNMFDSPIKGAEVMAERHGPVPNSYDNPYMWAYDRLSSHLKRWYAPPRYERHVNIQEIETCLCKWKSHLNGHYEVGKDIAEVKHGLERYKGIPLADQLHKAGSDLWKQIA